MKRSENGINGSGKGSAAKGAATDGAKSAGASLRELAEVMEAELARLRQVAEANQELERTVHALRESQQLFDAFMSHLPAAAWMKDLEGRYVFANAETERVFGTPVDVLLGKTSREVFPPDVARQFFEIDRKVLDDGGNLPPIEVVRESDGEERHLLVSKFVIRGPDGSPEYLAGVAIDTTQTRRLEEEVARLASFPMANPNPVIELDLAGNVTFCNPSAKGLLCTPGTPDHPNPFIPRDLPEIIEELSKAKVPQYLREVEYDGKFYEEVILLLPQHKSIRCYTMDITKRKHAERERERLLLQLQAVLEYINEGVIIFDLKGNVLNMNKEALALHGFQDVQEVLRHASHFQEEFELYTLTGEKLSFEDWPVMRAMRGERFFDYDVRIHSQLSGSSFIASYNGTPIRAADGEVILIVLTMRDVTARKEMEEEILDLNENLAARVAELVVTNQELEAFNRMVSHDLRQPLNTIGTSCQAVEMLCNVDEECKRYVRIAYSKVQVMNNLIDALLKFSRSTHREIKRERVNLSEMARSVYADLKEAEPERRVRLVAPDEVVAYGDPDLLRSVLENLIGNAWKYTAAKEDALIEFGWEVIGGERTYFVRDNGRGFEAADGEKLFTPFKRLSGAEEFSGFGIGLATVDRIVRRHGGRVCGDGAPGEGAVFYFTLPGEEAEASP